MPPPEPFLAAPAPVTPTEAAREPAAPLELRLARLEAQIEDLIESKERLERFAAAQNEELRVQRAAIARTQRVLRGVARPEDSGAEAAAPPPPLSD